MIMGIFVLASYETRWVMQSFVRQFNPAQNALEYATSSTKASYAAKVVEK